MPMQIPVRTAKFASGASSECLNQIHQQIQRIKNELTK